MRTGKFAFDAAKLAAEIDIRWLELTLGQSMRSLRHRRAMTQEELASRSGFSQAAISNIETTRNDPPWGTINQIFNALDCRPIILPKPINEWLKRPAQWRPC